MWEPDSVTQRGSSLATINHVQTLEGGWSNRRQEKLREAACCHSIAYFLNKQFVFSKEEHVFCFFCWGIRVLLLIICTRCGMLQADWPEDGPTVPKLSALLNHWHILTSWRHQLTTCIWTYIDILTTYHSWHNNMTTYDNNHRHLMKSLHPFFFVFLSCESSSAAQVTLLKFMQQRNFQAPSDWPGYRSLAIRKAWNAIELMRHDVKR